MFEKDINDMNAEEIMAEYAQIRQQIDEAKAAKAKQAEEDAKHQEEARAEIKKYIR